MHRVVDRVRGDVGLVAECCKVGSTRCARLKCRRRGLVVVVLKAARRVVPGSRPASNGLVLGGCCILVKL